MTPNADQERQQLPGVIVAERRPVYRDALVALLRGGLAEAKVAGAAGIEPFLDDPALAAPTLLLVGEDLVTDPERLRFLVQRLMDTRVVIHGADASPESIALAIASGIRGYVPVTAQPAVIVAALRLVLSGGVYVPESVLGARALRERPPAFATGETAASALAELTPRQRAVLDLIARGRSNKDIATELGISLATVKVHVNAILKHLHVSNRTAAALVNLGRATPPE